jgi:hypothetical protein
MWTAMFCGAFLALVMIYILRQSGIKPQPELFFFLWLILVIIYLILAKINSYLIIFDMGLVMITIIALSFALGIAVLNRRQAKWILLLSVTILGSLLLLLSTHFK